MTKKRLTVVIIEVDINIYIFFGLMCEHLLLLFLVTIGTVYALLSIFFFKHAGKTKYAVLYYYRYLIIM